MKKQIIKSILMTVAITQLSFFGTNALASEEKIKIDIVSDIVCPWCAIGYKRLNQAIVEMKIEDKIEIEWHPFELNPDMPREGENADKYLMKKLGLSEDELINKRKNVTKLGKKAGFKFNYFKDMRKLNTLNAHILLDYARKSNKQTELKVRLQEAYFGERKNISDRNVLYLEVKKVGLNADEAIARLDNIEAIKRVKEEEKYWKNRGIAGIPTMVFDDTLVKVGANTVDVYKQVLTELIEKRK